jgi:hypothetical protein
MSQRVDESLVVVCPTCRARVYPPCQACLLAASFPGGVLKLPPVDDALILRGGQPIALPGPEEIAAACLTIRESWSAKVRSAH